MKEKVYADWAATAPFDERLRDIFNEASWANPASLHTPGHKAARQLEDARHRIAHELGAHAPSEIVFTSGGTESDNTFIRTTARKVPGAKRTHVVTSAIEHEAVMKSARALRRDGFEVDALEPGPSGILSCKVLEHYLCALEEKGEACCLVAVMLVNNELGTIQPVREMACIAHEHGALFFCDAVQALGKVAIDLDKSGVDGAAFSAHKLGALKGFGFLYLRRSVPCSAFMLGGGQEAGMRSGTSNVLGALMCARAVEYAVAERVQTWEHLSELRTRLLTGINTLDARYSLRPTVAQSNEQVPHIISLLCDGVDGETMVLRLDNAGIAASAASACGTNTREPSHVIKALGVRREYLFNSLRLSFGSHTTADDIDTILSVLPKVVC